MTWYNINEEDRVKNVYSKYTIEDFWNWWSDKKQKAMEVRINKWEKIKETAKKFNIQYSTSGVYVWDYVMLKRVIMYLRNDCTLWFGINSRKKNWTRKGWKGWGSGEKGGSSDDNINSIDFIFVDIDRKIKNNNIATKQDLEDCDYLSNKIIETFGKENWNKSYLKICSGHGVQLLFKLDESLVLPQNEFKQESKVFIWNNEFKKMQKLIREGIGKDILKFTNKVLKEYEEKNNKTLNCEIDRSCFTLNRVGALPFTKNFKYNNTRWRGILDIVEGINNGLGDYVLSYINNIREYKKRKFLVQYKNSFKFKIKEGELFDNCLCKFLLENNFPMGGINNTLWCQLKCLLYDSKYNFDSEEFSRYHKLIKQKHNRTFTLNQPDVQFNPNVINNFCFLNLFPPVYDLWYNQPSNLQVNVIFNSSLFDSSTLIDCKTLDGEDIWEDIKIIQNKFTKDKKKNRDLILEFINSCIKKYGYDKTKFWFDNKYLERYLCYKQ